MIRLVHYEDYDYILNFMKKDVEDINPYILINYLNSGGHFSEGYKLYSDTNRPPTILISQYGDAAEIWCNDTYD